jgi:hypothetical protein
MCGESPAFFILNTMIKRIIPAFKYLFTGKVEMEKGAQELICDYLNYADKHPIDIEKSRKFYGGHAEFHNNILTYLSPQHFPEAYKWFLSQEESSHHQKLVDIQRKGRLRVGPNLLLGDNP